MFYIVTHLRKPEFILLVFSQITQKIKHNSKYLIHFQYIPREWFAKLSELHKLFDEGHSFFLLERAHQNQITTTEINILCAYILAIFAVTCIFLFYELFLFNILTIFVFSLESLIHLH